MRRSIARGRALLAALALLVALGCATRGAPPPTERAGDAGAGTPRDARAGAVAARDAVDADAVDADAVGGGMALREPAPPEAAPDPENRARPPSASADLQDRARLLLDAIALNKATLADDFFFPRAPFIPLKDVRDPGRYHDQLLAIYHRDIAALHGARRDWSSVTFVSFALGTAPRWVAPGKEYNKIGYYRTFHGNLRYRTGGDGGADVRTHDIEVGTIISWQGRWYVTHLTPIHR